MSFKKITIVLTLFSTFSNVIYAAEPTVISNYAELRQHLTHGHEVSAIIDLYNCRPSNQLTKNLKAN